MGDLGWNKIFFSILAAALIILGLREVSSLAFSDGHGHHGHGEEEEVDLNTKYARQFAYVIPVEGAADVPQEAPPEFDLATALASADPSAGERIMNGKCASCHNWNEGGANGTGPALYGVMGQDIAGVSGFQYSGVLNEKEGAWDYEKMNAFLENPSGWAPGTKMTFAGLRKGSDRANVLAFLETISPNAPAMPEPAPEAPAEDEGVEDAAAPVEDKTVEDAAVPAEETPGDAEVGAETGLEEAATPVTPGEDDVTTNAESEAETDTVSPSEVTGDLDSMRVSGGTETENTEVELVPDDLATDPQVLEEADSELEDAEEG